MIKYIIKPGTRVDVMDGVVEIEYYNGDLFYGTFEKIDMIEDENGELITNPDSCGLLPPEDWRATKGDLERMLRDMEGVGCKVIWEG